MESAFSKSPGSPKRPGQRWIDTPQQTGQNSTGPDFHKSTDAQGCEQANRLDPAHRTRDLLEESFASFCAGADRVRLPVVDEGEDEFAEPGCIEFAAETLLRGRHKGAVKGGADGQDYRFAGACGFRQVGGSLYGGRVSGDHDLIGRIQVRGAHNLALSSFGEDAVEFALRQFEQGRHGAHTGRDGLLHKLAALADEANGVREIEGAGGDERGVFAEAVAGGVIRREARFGEDGEGCDRDGQERGLGEFGELELLFRTFEAQARKGVTKGGIGRFKNAARGGMRVVEGFAHAN